MTFRIVIGYPTEFDREKYTLTAVIGKTETLYWDAEDVAKVLRRRSFPPEYTDTCMLDVTGALEWHSRKDLQRKRLFTHNHVIELLKNSDNPEVQEIERKINSQQTCIEVLHESYKPFNLENPTCIRLLDIPSEHSFFVWFYFFKETIMYEFYGIQKDTENVLFFSTLNTDSNYSFPSKLIIAHGEESALYIRSTSSSRSSQT